MDTREVRVETVCGGEELMSPVKASGRLVNLSINVTVEMLEYMDALVKGAGLAPSRCELVRMCLTDSLPRLKEMYEERIAIISEIKTSENYLTPNDVIFVRDNRNGKAYTKYKVVGEA